MGFPFDDATRELLIDSVIDTVLAGLGAPAVRRARRDVGCRETARSVDAA